MQGLSVVWKCVGGVCSTAIEVKALVQDDELIIEDVVIEGGCSGFGEGMRRLLKGMPVREAMERLKGTGCGDNPTSCPDQISRALSELCNGKSTDSTGD